MLGLIGYNTENQRVFEDWAEGNGEISSWAAALKRRKSCRTLGLLFIHSCTLSLSDFSDFQSGLSGSKSNLLGLRSGLSSLKSGTQVLNLLF